MKLKEFVIKHKKYLIACAVSLALGAGLSIMTNPTQDEVDKLYAQKSSLEEEYTKLTSDLDSEKTSIDELKDKLAKVEDEKTKKEEEIKLAKEEKEKEEAEKKAKEEEERKAQEAAEKEAAAQAEAAKAASSQSSPSTGASKPASQGVQDTKPKGQTVWITATGKKYHSKSNCGNSKTSRQVTLEQAQSQGLGPCSKCF